MGAVPREVVHDLVVLVFICDWFSGCQRGFLRTSPRGSPLQTSSGSGGLCGRQRERSWPLRRYSAAVVSPTKVFLSWCFDARFVGIPQDFLLPVDAQEEVEYPLHLCKIPVSSLPQVNVNCVTF